MQHRVSPAGPGPFCHSRETDCVTMRAVGVRDPTATDDKGRRLQKSHRGWDRNNAGVGSGMTPTTGVGAGQRSFVVPPEVMPCNSAYAIVTTMSSSDVSFPRDSGNPGGCGVPEALLS